MNVVIVAEPFFESINEEKKKEREFCNLNRIQIA